MSRRLWIVLVVWNGASVFVNSLIYVTEKRPINLLVAIVSGLAFGWLLWLKPEHQHRWTYATDYARDNSVLYRWCSDCGKWQKAVTKP